ncbi:MAG: dihydrofolate reductase [Candidatus Gottesmanbacteria bacterium]|nr:dihydrofolate reductase [Candidatus Gottesmanbacteria bacterium]
MGKNRELGQDNHLLWNIPSDLKRFRAITRGHPVIMGRKTYQSIGRPLPDRTNIVISSKSEISSLDAAIAKAQSSPGSEEIFVIGGGSVYAQAIDRADRLYLTVVDAASSAADTFFPDYCRFTKVISEEPHEENGIRYTYRTLEP